DAFWSNADAANGVGLENSYAQMLEYVAHYFNGNPDLKNDIAGFEIMNEPWPGSQWLPTLFGSPFFDTEELTPFYDQAASAIRAVDPTTPIFFQQNLLANFGVPTHLGTVDQAHTVLSFHDYCLTAQLGIDALNALCPADSAAVAENAEAYAESHGTPAVMTEFGSSNDLPAIADTEQLINQDHLNAMEFSYTGNNPTATNPNTQELVIDPSQPPVGDNVLTAKLAVIAEPSPQLVAGTPNSWSFDPGTETFNFNYSTEMADGSGDFAAGATTTISVPHIEYPNGYQVSVTGGHVVSGPNADELVIASNSGANTVTVVVNASGTDSGSGAG
ncbi:MAG: cellulase family glycosylhydrolase, partial [Mycobacterium sp.]